MYCRFGGVHKRQFPIGAAFLLHIAHVNHWDANRQRIVGEPLHVPSTLAERLDVP